MVRAIRGAITAKENTRQEIIDATKELLAEVVKANKIKPEHIISVIFSMSPDLNAEFPAVAAREVGWQFVPLFCAQEINKPGSLPRCIRLLMHLETSKKHKNIHHIYLREAVNLRPDLSERND